MKNEKKEYMAPEMTVVTFKAERGYAVSNPLLSMVLGMTDVPDDQEIWQVDNYEGAGWTNETI